MKARKKVGRPAKITLPVVEAIGQWIALGMTEEQACCKEGVSVESFRTAKKRNREFEPSIKRAQAEFLGSALLAIRAGAPGWQGAAWILERRHKPQFNRTDTHALTDAQGGQLLLSAEEFAELERNTKQRVRGMR